jgi:hypothetical protein
MRIKFAIVDKDELKDLEQFKKTVGQVEKVTILNKITDTVATAVGLKDLYKFLSRLESLYGLHNAYLVALSNDANEAHFKSALEQKLHYVFEANHEDVEDFLNTYLVYEAFDESATSIEDVQENLAVAVDLTNISESDIKVAQLIILKVSSQREALETLASHYKEKLDALVLRGWSSQ